MILLTRTLRDAVQLPRDGAVVCQPYNRHYTSRCSFSFLFFLFPQLPLFPLSLLFLFIASSTMSSFGDRFVSPARLPADSYTSTVNHLEGIRHISTAIYDFNSISGAQRGNDVRIERPAIFGQKFLFFITGLRDLVATVITNSSIPAAASIPANSTSSGECADASGR